MRVQSTGVNPRCASAPPMTSASAGKMGFCSSGSTRPMSRARCPRSWVGRSYPSTSRAVSTASLVLSDTPALPLSTRLTVASLTPTFLATSASRRAGVRVMPATIRHLPAKVCVTQVTHGAALGWPGRRDGTFPGYCVQDHRDKVVSLHSFINILPPDVDLCMFLVMVTVPPRKGSIDDQTALPTELPPARGSRRRGGPGPRRRGLLEQLDLAAVRPRPGGKVTDQHRLRAARGAAASAAQGVD